MFSPNSAATATAVTPPNAKADHKDHKTAAAATPVADVKTLHQYVATIHTQLEQKKVDGLVDAIANLGDYLLSLYSGLDIEKINKKITSHAQPMIPLPDLTFIACFFDALAEYSQDVSLKSGLATNSLVNSLKCGLNAYATLVDNTPEDSQIIRDASYKNDDEAEADEEELLTRFSETLKFYNENTPKEILAQHTENFKASFEKKLYTCMESLITSLLINEIKPTLAKLKKGFYASLAKQKSPEDFVEDLLRHTLHFVLQEDGELNPNIAAAFSKWMETTTGLKAMMQNHYKQLDENTICAHFSRLLLTAAVPIPAADQKDAITLLTDTLPIMLMDTAQIEAIIKKIREEQSILYYYANKYAVTGHDRELLKPLLVRFVPDRYNLKPSALSITTNKSFFYKSSDACLFAYLAEKHPEYASNVKNNLCQMMADKRLTESRFLNSFRLLCLLGRSDLAIGVCMHHHPDGKEPETLTDNEISAIFRLLAPQTVTPSTPKSPGGSGPGSHK